MHLLIPPALMIYSVISAKILTHGAVSKILNEKEKKKKHSVQCVYYSTLVRVFTSFDW